MAWTAPRTWVAGELVTAALLNTHVRDNLLVTAPAVMTTTGDMVYASAANTPARLAGAVGLLHGAVGAAPSYSAVITGDIAANAITPAVQSDTSSGETTTGTSDITNLTKTVTLTAGSHGFVVLHGLFTCTIEAINTMQAKIGGSLTGFQAIWQHPTVSGRVHVCLVTPFTGLSGSTVFTATMSTNGGTLTASATQLDVYEFLK